MIGFHDADGDGLATEAEVRDTYAQWSATESSIAKEKKTRKATGLKWTWEYGINDNQEL